MGVAKPIISIVKAITGLFQVVELNETRTYPATDIKQIKVRVNSPDVRIVPTEQEELSIKLKGRVSKRLKDQLFLDIKQTSESLKIMIDHVHHFFFGINTKQLTLLIEVPRKTYESIIVATSSGDIDAEGLSAGVVDLRASSGDIEAKNIRADEKIVIETSSGEIDAGDIQGKAIDVQASSGDVSLKDVAGALTKVKTSSGDVDIDHLIGDLSTRTSSGEIEIDSPEPTGHWKCRASSGNVSVRFQDIPSLAVDFSGGSGSGRIKHREMVYQEHREHRIAGVIGTGDHLLEVETNSGDFDLR